MSFLARYPITPVPLPSGTKRRSGLLLSPGVRFIVAHDTGNTGSTARMNVSYFARTSNEANASAHLFVDDREILECIPVTEKAWHVRYDVRGDDELYGHDANDAAIGVEYCFGTNINADEAYKRYVWVLAYLCDRFGLDPAKAIIGHFLLDPSRRSDPKSGLAASARTYEGLLRDVAAEYTACRSSVIQPPVPSTHNPTPPMRLIKNPASQKVYAIGTDQKKHWIFNQESFTVGRDMGLWGDWPTVEIVPDDGFAEGHTILFVK